MKRLLEILLCSALVLCMSGCGNTVPAAESSESTTVAQTTKTSESKSDSETAAAT